MSFCRFIAKSVTPRRRELSAARLVLAASRLPAFLHRRHLNRFAHIFGDDTIGRSTVENSSNSPAPGSAMTVGLIPRPVSASGQRHQRV